MFTLRQYLMTLDDSCGLTRTLGELDVCRDETGRPVFNVGNSAAVFRIRHEGRIRTLRCYLRPQRHLREIYGERLLEKELYLYTSPENGVWVDVVLGEWIEGMNLHEAIAEAAVHRDTGRLARLAAAFDRLAAAMVADDRAHGDLKPENILVDRAGCLHPIDFDAAYLPQFAGETSPELGTAAYQHPARTPADFNERLDDYPAVLIATALHALTVDPTLWDRYGNPDMLLYDPRKIASDAALQETFSLFERAGMACAYRIAQLLQAPALQLFGLPELLAEAVREAGAGQKGQVGGSAEKKGSAGEQAGGPSEEKGSVGEQAGEPSEEKGSVGEDPGTAVPELFAENGRWGYRTARRVVVPPLYDNGFDFSEGLAAVLLGRTWHFIDTEGRIRISCPGCRWVKPFRNGRAQAERDGKRVEIDPAGGEFDF